MIEVSDTKHHKFLHTYVEASLYCLLLDGDGHRDWRLPTWDEWSESPEMENSYAWVVQDISTHNRAGTAFMTPAPIVIPVRTITQESI